MASERERRIKYISNRFKSMEELLNNSITANEEQQISHSDFSIRLNQVKADIDDYQDLHYELLDLDQEHELVKKLSIVQDKYFRHLALVSPPPANAEFSSFAPSLGESTHVERRKLPQLPTPSIPKFDGNIENWISFKSIFASIIDSRPDLDDLSKFIYLRDSLQGDALRVISSYHAINANYKRALEALDDIYEKPRLLIDTHIDALLNLTPIPKSTPATLLHLINTLKHHLNALNSLNQQVYDRMILRIAEQALPADTRNEWECSLTLVNVPTLSQFYTFLNGLIYRLNTIKNNDSQKTHRGVKRTFDGRHHGGPSKNSPVQLSARTLFTSSSLSQPPPNCILCKGSHYLYACADFAKRTIQQRWELVKERNLCRNCLRFHTETCTSKNRCKTCDKPHHTSLHAEKRQSEKNTKDSKKKDNSSFRNKSESSSLLLRESNTGINMYLSTSNLIISAMIRVQDKSENSITARTLLDTCSTVNLVTEKLVQQLQLPTVKCSVSINGLDQLKTSIEGYVYITLNATHSKFQKTLKCLVVPEIAKRVPQNIFSRSGLNIPANIKLADPQFHLPRPVDMLLNASTTLSLMSLGQINVSTENNSIILQKSRLGWLVAGNSNSEVFQDSQSCLYNEVDSFIEEFWKIEDLNADVTFSSEENACEEHFIRHTTRDQNGRYIVRLPFRPGSVNLGESRTQALKRFYSLENKLNRDPKLKQEYFKVMQEYVDMGHMILVNDESIEGYYLPHHPVIKKSSDTTKVRVVFDASAKTSNGYSLNDLLMVGPTIQDNIFEQLLKMRTHKYIVTADIEKMYRQVIMHSDDRKFQRIFWYHNGKIRTFELATVTFGVSAAPFLAIRTLKQLAIDERDDFPKASKILMNDMYVDDLGSGGSSVEEILKIRDDMIQLLKRGGFNIRQWASNHKNALDNISEQFANLEWTVKENSVVKTLGTIWNVLNDQLIYTTNVIDLNSSYKKRKLLSEISKIFDPLGLLGPVILHAKLLVQDCWRAKLNWDESLPQDLYTRWVTLVEQFHHLDKIKFDRCILIDNPEKIEIHGFCDASIRGYGACIYIRSVDNLGNKLVRLVCAKSRVTPVTKTTIPRLELCAAKTLSTLYKVVCAKFKFLINRSVCWSDSTIVLSWLRKAPGDLKTFESNRVSKIQELGDHVEWRHVRSADNPADALSRGQLPLEFISNKQWMQGPDWLSLEEDSWPSSVNNVNPDNEFCLITSETNTNLITRFSSFNLLLRVVARMCRWRKSKALRSGPITVTEIEESESKILQMTQREHFSTEFKYLSHSNVTSQQKTRLAHLNPFIDENNLIRVGGRLKNANLTFNEKYPILLPKNNHLTDLIIRHTHLSMFHAGIQTTLYRLRHKFWILNGKDQVRKIIRNCVTCIREKPHLLQAKMAALPESRVTDAPAFYHVGVDYFGPLYLKERKKQNRTTIKAYGSVFVCMATKAVHIELVSDLTTDSFLNALKRFIARRGKPRHIYSDNGLNFVGANNQLKELYHLLKSEDHTNIINNYALNQNIIWHFNPPLSPHFGGLWEAAVKSFKHHLKRVLKNQLVTFEEMDTLLIQIEAILNSRPLCTLSSDPNDPLVISPAHLLLARKTECLPEPNLTLQ